MKLSGVVQNLVTVVVVTAPLSAQATGREVDSKPSDLTFVAALGRGLCPTSCLRPPRARDDGAPRHRPGALGGRHDDPEASRQGVTAGATPATMSSAAQRVSVPRCFLVAAQDCEPLWD